VVKFRANGATFTIKCSSAEAPVQGRASIIVLGTGHPVAAA